MDRFIQGCMRIKDMTTAQIRELIDADLANDINVFDHACNLSNAFAVSSGLNSASGLCMRNLSIFSTPFISDLRYPKLNKLLKDLSFKYEVAPNAIAAAWLLKHPADCRQ